LSRKANAFYIGGTPGQGGQGGFRMNPNQEQEQKKPLEQFVSILFLGNALVH
jgi:hypothetical protein